ncbi:formyltetrahydrofolate deformylase [Roseospira visakhapatnamensis]|uniref:Formyltetrahydrofolate deformylase n=1 Tax=Roseospira visakhapatnamensis TaxID=390880 RepID=A0A7W6RBG3_9PROT|nr:formyltetrahydrofolate deformylase [Roseospira visakhapatnamensis]MBB4265466.1 formyltetrahydrofolate deformylase [Roseospira visakhapatnamensis]
MNADPNTPFILILQCPDGIGVQAAVMGFLAGHQAFITESHSYGDPLTGRFFMRVVYRAGHPTMPDLATMKAHFQTVATNFGMDWDLRDATQPPRVLIAVSRFGHCMNDLLHRWKTGQLHIDVPVVVSNHEDLRDLAEWHGIPFHHLPVTPETKADQERRLLDLVDEHRVDLVVLARYMQVLSKELSAALAGRCINIHHSFLPSFKGARPYHQAHARGVKIIGATAHYVTATLDEGPIIEQEVVRVDHTFTREALVRMGRDVETVTLARAVRWHCERRVFINDNKTVVFN